MQIYSYTLGDIIAVQLEIMIKLTQLQNSRGRLKNSTEGVINKCCFLNAGALVNLMNLFTDVSQGLN